MALQPYIPEVVTMGWMPILEQRKMLDGTGVIIESGYEQVRVVKLWWINEQELLNLRITLDRPEFFPRHEGWSYEMPAPAQPIIDTVKIYNITISGRRYSPTPK